MTLAEILAVYNGSNGKATKELYERLNACGPLGHVAVNVFRALKTSERAKVYRGRGFRDESYGRKSWSIDNLTKILTERAGELGIGWGWKVDPKAEYHRWVIYIDLPTGQVSFHAEMRGEGPDYPGQWDEMRKVGPQRICRLVEQILNGERR